MRIFVVSAATLLLAASSAHAAAPSLVAASHDQRRPALRWTLPPNVDAVAVSIATSPARGADGGFLSSNEVLVDPVDPDAVEWRHPERLEPGIYYALVVGYDRSCLAGAAPCGVSFSNVLALAIGNAAPTVEDLAWTLRRQGSRHVATARLRICDDAEGPISVRVRQRRTRGGRTRARSEHVDDVGLNAPGCRVVTLSWMVSRRFLARGPYTVRITVRDEDGATGNTVQITWTD